MLPSKLFNFPSRCFLIQLLLNKCLIKLILCLFAKISMQKWLPKFRGKSPLIHFLLIILKTQIHHLFWLWLLLCVITLRCTSLIFVGVFINKLFLLKCIRFYIFIRGLLGFITICVRLRVTPTVIRWRSFLLFLICFTLIILIR